MSSIVTNTAAMTALQSLNATMKSMEVTQGRISTGLRVNNASDNAAYWSIATTMRSDKSALSTVSDALNLGSSTIDVASTGLNSAIDVAGKIKDKLVAARQPGIDRNKVQAEISELQKQLKSISDSASFSGQNWLSIDSTANGGNTTKSIVSSYQNGAVSTISFDSAGIALFDGGASTAATVARDDVTFSAAAASNLETDLAALFTTPATGDTASVALMVNGSEQSATVTYNGTGYDIAYSSYVGADETNATTTVQVKGSANAPDIVDYTAVGVVTAVNEQHNVASSGILGKAGANSGLAIAAFDANGDLDTTQSINIAALSDSTADLQTLDNYIKDVDASISSMTSAAANIGSVKSRVTLQQDFVTALMDSIDKGVGSLVDADMNKESTRLQALQVQQQLGVQALSIANQSSQTILSLFRG